MIKRFFPFALLLAALPFACDGGGVSGRMESCANSADCKAGLLCVNQTCIQNEYPVAATAKECVAIECAETADCCDDFEPDEETCSTLETACDEGDTIACSQYDSFCVCPYTCEDEICVAATPTCETDEECFGGYCGPEGSCVQCLENEHCDVDEGESCIENVCTAGCEFDEECPLFETCQEGVCEYTGCTSDRECILLTDNADAVCIERDGRKGCSVPCEKNTECGELNVCQDGECVYLGCETNEECVNVLKARGALGPDEKAECRDMNPAD